MDSALRFDLDLLALGRVSITEVVFFQYGSYSILGSGDVSASGRITVIDRYRPSVPYTDVLRTNVPMPVANSLPDPGFSGIWEGMMGVQIPFPYPESVSHLTISIDTQLSATSALALGGNPGGTAFIGNQFSPAGFVITLILSPEPSTLALLVLSTPLVLGRGVRAARVNQNRWMN